MKNANTLRLRKCAYIFDSSASRFFYGTKSQYAEKAAMQKEMKRYYDEPEKLTESVEYTTDANGYFIITVNGKEHRLNDLQIEEVENDPENIINNRKDINVDSILPSVPHFHKFCSADLYSNKYRSLTFEFFTSVKDLGYIRVHFNGWHEQFVIDNRNGDIYTSGEHGKHKKTSTAELIKRLNIKSVAARKEFIEVINAITK